MCSRLRTRSRPHRHFPNSSRRTFQVRTLLAVLALAVAAPTYAAHPLATEDSGTQGRAHVELELGYQRTRESGAWATEMGAQLSYGVVDNVDAIVRPSIVWLTGGDAPGHGFAG